MSARDARIDWVAPPFAGHLFPMLALARGLAERGFAGQRIVTTPRYAAEVRAAGLPFAPILADREEAILRTANGDARVGKSPFALLRQFRATVRHLGALQPELRSLWAEDKPAIVIADSVLPTVGPVAAAHGARWWTSLASVPTLETPDGPPAYLGGLGDGIGPFARAKNAAGRRAVRGFKRLAHLCARRDLRAFGLPRVYRPDGSEACYSDDTILALGAPELEFAARWPGATRFVGPPRSAPVREADAPALDPGRKHLLVTLGTHLAWAKEDALAEARALGRALRGWTIHFSHGDARGRLDRREANVRELSWVPYGDNLAGYRAVLHPGGAGILYATLRAGVPALVRPRDFDQFDNAARLVARGLGIRVDGDAVNALRRIEALRPACEAFAAKLATVDPVREVTLLLEDALD